MDKGCTQVSISLDFFVVVAQSFSLVWLCDPMDYSTLGFPVLHHLPELAQTHVHWVSDAIQPSCPVIPLLFLFLGNSPLTRSHHSGLTFLFCLFIFGCAGSLLLPFFVAGSLLLLTFSSCSEQQRPFLGHRPLIAVAPTVVEHRL